jgi:iron complex outermembrane recepter protein
MSRSNYIRRVRRQALVRSAMTAAPLNQLKLGFWRRLPWAATAVAAETKCQQRTLKKRPAKTCRWIFSLSLLFGVGAFAQETPPAAQSEPQQLAEVVVTGSRIAAPNAVSTSPIQVLSTQYIEQTGKSDISDVLLQLPQILNNSVGQDLGNGTSGLSTPAGVATADLRGLGPNRTLVLVDGRRLGQGSPNTAIQSPAPDLDQIPSGLVERVEVLTGGASAVYGSDAIAGVVNFIMKKNFEGLQVDAQYNENWHHQHDTFMQNLTEGFGTTPATGTIHDGQQRNFDVLMGSNFADGEGNVTAYISYRHADPVPSSNRDFGGCELYPVFDASGTIVTGPRCGGSANSNLFAPNTGPNAGNAYSVLGNQFVDYGTPGTVPPAEYNSQSNIFMTREDDRYNAAMLAHMHLNDYFEPYAEFYFMRDETTAETAPAAAFLSSNPFDPALSGAYPVNCNNPLLSAQQQATLCSGAQIAFANANPTLPCTSPSPGTLSTNCADVDIGRRNLEGGARVADFSHQNYRIVLGSKGEALDGGVMYDLYGQYYYTTFQSSNSKFFNFQSIDNALDVYAGPNGPQCVSGGACVPWNIFNQGGVNQAQVNYLYITGLAVGSSTLKTMHADVTADLGKWGIKSPFANDGIATNVGFEHRVDQEVYLPDYAEQNQLLSGFGSAAAAIDNSLTSKEGFAELRVPLVQNLPFAKDILFDTGYRYSRYDSNSSVGPIAFNAHTYKFELQYAPIQDIRIRASYDKAIRAPSLIELYNPQLVGLIQSGNDPCAGTPTYSQAQCANLGVSAAQYAATVAGTAVNGVNPIPQCVAGQCSQLTGGNPHLQPEQAETYSIGVNFQPSFLPKLTGSIDYYHIALNGEVSTLPYATIISNCANTGNPLYCSQVVRSPVTGGIQGSNLATGGYVIQTNVNIGAGVLSGIDTQLNYTQALPPGFGDLRFDLNGAWLQRSISTPIPGGGSYNCVGLYGSTCQTVNPRWHHILRTTWTSPWDVSASLAWRFISPVHLDGNTGDPLMANSNFSFDQFDARIPSFSYLDLEADWHPTKILTVRAGINNMLDKDPPLLIAQLGIVAGGAANTSDTYDMFGRQLFVGFTAKF